MYKEAQIEENAVFPKIKVEQIPAIKVKQVVDTTGAGDCFLGAFAAALAENNVSPDAHSFESMKAAAQYGVQAAARAVGKKGAQASFPARRDLGVV